MDEDIVLGEGKRGTEECVQEGAGCHGAWGQSGEATGSRGLVYEQTTSARRRKKHAAVVPLRGGLGSRGSVQPRGRLTLHVFL